MSTAPNKYEKSIASSKQEPKFPWDTVVPETPFWNNIDWPVAKSFVSLFNADELAALEPKAPLPVEEKLTLMSAMVQSKLAETEDPDYRSYRAATCAMQMINEMNGHHQQNLELAREVHEKASAGSGQRDLSTLLNLSYAQMKVGEYAGCEASAREVLPMLQGREELGRSSPQALGCMRMMVEALWKQEKYAEAEEWMGKCRSCIEEMEGGKFAKYAEEEKEALDELVKDLQGQDPGSAEAGGHTGAKL